MMRVMTVMTVTMRLMIRSMMVIIVVMMMVRGVRLVGYLCNDKRVSSTVRLMMKGGN